MTPYKDKCAGVTYRRQSNIGNNDSVQCAGSSAQALVLVTMRMVLVLVDFPALILAMPGHGTLADANVALGVDRCGFSAEVPILYQAKERKVSHSVEDHSIGGTEVAIAVREDMYGVVQV